MNWNRATATMAGLDSGITTRVQDLPVAAAVDADGVEQLVGDGQEELAQQEDREGVAEEVGDDQRLERADELDPGPVVHCAPRGRRAAPT